MQSAFTWYCTWVPVPGGGPDRVVVRTALEAGREAARDPAVITRGPTRPNDSRQTHVEQSWPM